MNLNAFTLDELDDLASYAASVRDHDMVSFIGQHMRTREAFRDLILDYAEQADQDS